MMHEDSYNRFAEDSDFDEDGGPGRHVAPPVDNYKIIYMAMLLAGIGCLLPYNSFTIAVDYFLKRYPNSTVVFDISIVYIFVAFGAVLLNNLLVELISLSTRIIFGYIVALLMLLFVSFFEIWWPDFFPGDVSYVVTLISVAIVAFGCTIQQSSFYGYTSMLPQRYTQAVMTGESTAGLIVSANRIITKVLLHNQRVNTAIFFIISITFSAVCLICFIAVQKTDFIQFYLNLCRKKRNDDDLLVLDVTEDTVNCDIGSICESLDESMRSSVTGSESTATVQSSVTMDTTATIQPREWTLRPSYRVEHVVHRRRHIGAASPYTKIVIMWSAIKRGVISRWEVGKNIWQLMASIALAYFTTLCLYPGIVTEVTSCRFGTWMPIFMMAVFNLFDFSGKIIATTSYDWSRRQLLTGSLLRIILIPGLMFCAAPRDVPMVPYDIVPFILSAILGITNGIFGSIPMYLAPGKVRDEHRELTGNIMTLSYNVGLTFGACVAYLLYDLLGPLHSRVCE